MSTSAVLFHADCPDGWTAAWVAHRALTSRDHPPVKVDLHPVSHGGPLPQLGDADTVWILDFSYPHEMLQVMGRGRGIFERHPRRVVVLDHHQTAVDTLSTDDDDYEAVLDTNRSGAGITWDYFHPGEPRPALVNYVEDRDLWRSALPFSKAVSSYIRCQPYTLDAWDELAGISVDDMADEGEGVLLHIDAYCRAATKHAYWCQMGDRTFPIVNVPYESCSDVANHMLDHFGTDMAGYFFERGPSPGGWQYGFRSRNGVTVHDHALAFGGGGHPQASGCVVDQLAHTRIEAPS